jgi:flagellin
MISLNTNLAADAGRRQFEIATHAMNQSLERLSTGQRINRASDDPSGMIAGESLKAEQRSIEKKLDRIDFQSHRLGAVDGAQSVVQDLLLELNGVVVQAANKGGLADGELRALQTQADSILQTIDYIATTSTFNGERILEGSTATNLGVDSHVERQGDGTFKQVRHSLASLAGGKEFNLIDGDIEGAQQVVQAAVAAAATRRGAVGAVAKDLESQRAELQTRLENVAAAKSQILDTDFAAETAALIRAQILRQASIFVQRTALTQSAGLILSLLK